MKKIVIIAPYNNDISVHPSIYQGAQILKEKGFTNTLITSNTVEDATMQQNFNKIIRIPYFKHRNAIVLFFNSLLFSYYVLKCHPKYLMVYDHHGAEVVFFALPFLRKTKLIYFNLEVYTNTLESSEAAWIAQLKYKIRKTMEKVYNQKSKWFVIQDALRYELSKKYEVSNDNISFIPNSYIYDEKLLNEKELERKEKVLFAGALEQWALQDIFENIELIKNVDITFAGWSKDKFIDSYKELTEKQDNIHIIQQRLSTEEYTAFINQFGIGLIYYTKQFDENITVIGMASGKFFKFLSLGKPVIVLRMQGMAEEVEKYKLGIVIDNLSQLDAAVSEIVNDYAGYRTRVLKTYKEHYDFRKLANRFFDNLS